MSVDYENRVCAWCGLKGSDHEMVDSWDKGPRGPELVRVHIDCLENWNDRTQPLPGGGAMNDDREKARCMFEEFVRALTAIMNVIGVEETVSILRSSADKLEANRGLLEGVRAKRRPTVQA